MLDRFDALLFVTAAFGGSRVGHIAQRDKLGLLLIIERAADLDFVALRDANARFEKIESCLACRPTASH